MRKSTIGCWLFAGVVAVASTFAVGCANETETSTERPAIDTIKDGLNIFEATPEGLSGAFKAGDRVVFFQTKVGGLKPQTYRDTYPDEPKSEIDARFVDSLGHTFRLQIAGDTLLDPKWDADIAKGRENKDKTPKALREKDFEMARDAGIALAKAAPAGMQDHVYHIVNLGRDVPHLMPTMVARAAEIHSMPLPTDAKPIPTVPGGSTSPTGETAYNASCSYNFWEGDLTYKEFIWSPFPPHYTHHSAVTGWNYSNCTSTWDETVVSCNHGTCSNASNMSFVDYTTSGWVSGNKSVSSNWSKETQTVQGTAATNTGACTSGYNWNTPPGHVCNDDSAFELWAIYDGANYGGANTSKGTRSTFNWANDGNQNGYSCNCNGASKGQPGNCQGTSSGYGDWRYPTNPGRR